MRQQGFCIPHVRPWLTLTYSGLHAHGTVPLQGSNRCTAAANRQCHRAVQAGARAATRSEALLALAICGTETKLRYHQEPYVSHAKCCHLSFPHELASHPVREYRRGWGS